jgi:hypothetical protein
VCAAVAVCCGDSCWAPLAILSKRGGELHRWSILLRGHEGERKGGRGGRREGGGYVTEAGMGGGCVHHSGKPGAVWQECLIM